MVRSVGTDWYRSASVGRSGPILASGVRGCGRAVRWLARSRASKHGPRGGRRTIPVPSMATAIGSIRTTVRLAAAYRATRPVQRTQRLAEQHRPEQQEGDRVEQLPGLLGQEGAVLGPLTGDRAEDDPGGEGGDEPAAAQRGDRVGQQRVATALICCQVPSIHPRRANTPRTKAPRAPAATPPTTPKPISSRTTFRGSMWPTSTSAWAMVRKMISRGTHTPSFRPLSTLRPGGCGRAAAGC